METRYPRVGDLLKTPALGWSIRKMEASLRGIALGWAAYCVFTYLALLAGPARSGGFIALFRMYEFFPWLPRGGGGILSAVLWIAGIIVAAGAVLDAALAVSVIALEDLRGNAAYMTPDAFRSVRVNRAMLYVSMAALFAIALVFAAGFAVAGLVARIPYAGELLIGLKALFLIAWGILGAAALLTFLWGFNTVPAIIACGAEDVLETVIEAYSMVWSRPIRFLLLQVAARVMAAVPAALVGLLAVGGCVFAGAVLAPAGGLKISELFTVALYRIPFLMDSEVFLRGVYRFASLFGTPFIADTTAVATTVRIAGWMLGAAFLAAGAWVLSYFFSVFWSAQTVIRLVLGGRFDRAGIPGTETPRAVEEKKEPAERTGP